MATEKVGLKAEYLDRVTRGEGFMPWQEQERVSPEEVAFREEMERRKEGMLARRMRVRRPALLTEREVAQARRNIEETEWGKAWFEKVKEIADHIVHQPAGYVERMIPELTPTNPYGLTCPRCVGEESQEGLAYRAVEWDYRNPEFIRCRACGQTYPDERYPETGRLVCPRRGQTFTYYLNEGEREHPDDRSGRYAWKWVGKPVHSSFSGFVRWRKIDFMTSASKSLALAYRFTEDPRYAERAVRILERFAHCYPNWLYHDFYDTVADCDPLYAAWHDMDLKLEWKRHLCTTAYGGVTYETGPVDDAPDRAKMLATYFGCGRITSSADSISSCLGNICLAYDLARDARGSDGGPVWTEALRRKVERDLILEYLMTAEPFVGGAGRPPDLGNKSPYVYGAQAVVGKCLGLHAFADAALRGYEGVRDRSFLFDGFSKESPAYTNMYLASLIWVPETLHGFRWPKGFSGRAGRVNVYRDDPKLRLMLRTALDQLRPDGRYLPLSDTESGGGPSAHIFEVGLRRCPEIFSGKLSGLCRGLRPTEYAVFHLNADELEKDTGLDLPEAIFPAWRTAALRHGRGTDATVLALPFNPPGGHRQPDNLALYYVDRGRTILGDLGYVGDSPMNRWIRSTSFSHNLVVVDDQDQPLRARTPGLRLMVTSPRVSVVEASSKVYAQCREYRRLVALIKGPDAQTFAVDIFRVKGGVKHTYRLFSELASSDAKKGALAFTGLDMPPEGPLPDFGASVAPEHIFGLRDARRTEGPPASWQATWREQGRRYRLHALSQADAVEASNGPGQETLTQIGRRVRFLDILREGQDLESAFVAIHEPSGPSGSMPVRKAERLAVPAQAGPDGVALRIASKWGTYLVFSEFEGEAEVAGVRFQGTFGVLCLTPEGGRWMLTCGANTLKGERAKGRKGERGNRTFSHSPTLPLSRTGRKGGEGFGFEGAPTAWSGRVVRHTERELTTDTERPSGWPAASEGAYVLTGSGGESTGFPVRSTGKRRIVVERFPLQPAEWFVLPAVQWREE